MSLTEIAAANIVTITFWLETLWVCIRRQVDFGGSSSTSVGISGRHASRTDVKLL